MKKTFRIFSNKFLLTGAFFIVWMLFFDQNDWHAQHNRKKELKETENNITYLQEEISRMEHAHHVLTSDPAKLEAYAREQYRMKKDNEDVYVTVSE